MVWVLVIMFSMLTYSLHFVGNVCRNRTCSWDRQETRVCQGTGFVQSLTASMSGTEHVLHSCVATFTHCLFRNGTQVMIHVVLWAGVRFSHCPLQIPTLNMLFPLSLPSLMSGPKKHLYAMWSEIHMIISKPSEPHQNQAILSLDQQYDGI